MNDFLSTLTHDEYEFILAASLLIALTSFYLFFHNWKRSRIIEDTPTAKLRSAHQGYIELEGKGQVADGQPIYAPLSNHLCIWYHSQIECLETIVNKGRSQTNWNTIYENTSDHHFKLIDGTNSCFVDPTGAEIKSNEKLVWYGDTEWPVITNILESQSIIHRNQNRYRYTERLILPGQPLYILGQFSTFSPSNAQSLNAIVRNLLADWKANKQQLLKRFDANNDGEIDQDEWESARKAAQTQAQQLFDKQTLEPDVNLIAKPYNTQYPYIISVHPQKLLIKKYRYTTSIAFAICLIMVGYIFWLVQSYK